MNQQPKMLARTIISIILNNNYHYSRVAWQEIILNNAYIQD